MANSNFNISIASFAAVIDGKCVVNTTPHALAFLSKEGETVIVPSSVPAGEKTSEWVVNARAVEEQVGEDLVRTVFVGTPEGEAILDKIEEWAREEGHDNLRIVGSIIAAQAYPGRVLGMCPAPGYERVAPAEKLMTAERFISYDFTAYVVVESWYSGCGDWPNAGVLLHGAWASEEEVRNRFRGGGFVKIIKVSGTEAKILEGSNNDCIFAC